MGKTYRWANPHEWLLWKVEKSGHWNKVHLQFELKELALRVDGDTLQDSYQDVMEKDGYFKETTQ